MSTENTLHLDAEAIARELPPIPGTPAGTPAPGAAPTGQAPAALGPDPMHAWGSVAQMAVDILVKGVVAPNWTIEDPPRKDLIEAVAGVLNDLMPGGLGAVDSWGPYGKLVFACGAVAMANFDASTMTLKPLRKRPAKPKPADQAPARPADPDIVVKGTADGPADQAPAEKPAPPAKKKRTRKKAAGK